jgi:dihydrofolate reductase
MLSYVVAVSENNVIGNDNRLIWSLPKDLQKFKEITLTKSKTMIMGRQTFESLPGVLPGRKHIILTRNKNYRIDDANVEIIHDIDELKPYIESSEEYFVIGGGEIFSLLMPYVEKMYITIIHEHFPGDTSFPEYNKDDWKVVESIEGIVDEENKHKHTFLILERNQHIN